MAIDKVRVLRKLYLSVQAVLVVGGVLWILVGFAMFLHDSNVKEAMETCVASLKDEESDWRVAEQKVYLEELVKTYEQRCGAYAPYYGRREAKDKDGKKIVYYFDPIIFHANGMWGDQYPSWGYAIPGFLFLILASILFAARRWLSWLIK